jgi:hypothetical protein
MGGECNDSACTASSHGYCDAVGVLNPICECVYGCVRDAECGASEICLCGSAIGKCVHAACATDADCNPGSQCLSYEHPDGCNGTIEFACSTPADECLSEKDCPTPTGVIPQVCGHDGTKRICVDVGECTGRPLVIGRDFRVAPVQRSRAWTA